MGRFSAKFGANLKRGFSTPELIDDASALLAVPVYAGLPMLFKLEGYPALAVGAGGAYVLGKLFDIPAMGHAALGIAAYHILTDNNDKVQEMTGKSLFALNPQKVAAVQTALQQSAAVIPQQVTQAALQGLASSPQVAMDSFNDVPVMAYRGEGGYKELPSSSEGVQGLSNWPVSRDELSQTSVNEGGSIFSSNSGSIFGAN